MERMEGGKGEEEEDEAMIEDEEESPYVDVE
jgi:hypothetical protein